MESNNKKLLELAGHYDKQLNPNVDAAWNKFEKQMKQEGKVVEGNFGRRWLSIAAGIAVVVAAFFFVTAQPELQTIQTAENQKQEVDLPDGTKVWVNESSTFSNTNFEGNTRLVQLEGEAFFDVAPDVAKPFVIESGDFKIEVLGTAFNVRNYSGDKFEVTVKEGTVKVLKEGMEPIILKKNGIATFSTSQNKFHKYAIGIENMDAWIDNVLIFNDHPLADVVGQIERLYDIKLAIRTQGLGKCLVTANFEDIQLEEVIETIETLFDCEIEKKAKDAYVLKGGSCN